MGRGQSAVESLVGRAASAGSFSLEAPVTKSVRNEQQLRTEIMALIDEYYVARHAPKPFVRGESPAPVSATY